MPVPGQYTRSGPSRASEAEGSRTPDLRRAKAALSQLSYGPVRGPPTGLGVGVPGIEPGTSVLSGLRSNRLSYTPQATAESRRPQPAKSEGERGGGQLMSRPMNRST